MTIQFIPTDIQTMLRDGLRRWGSERDVRIAEPFEDNWRFAAEQGWLGAGLPEEAGGLGGDAFDTAVIAEEFGRALVRAPFVEVAAAAFLLRSLAPERLEAVVSGAFLPVLAHDEPEARGDPAWVTTTARAVGDIWRLTGRKSAIVGAGHAGSFLVTARIEGEGIALFELAAETAPLHLYRTIDDRSGGELGLEGTAASLLAEPGELAEALSATLDYRLVMESVEMLGTIEHAQAMTRDYLMTRKQYGQIIGEFQALRHRIADMFIEAEQGRSIVWRALGAIAAGDPHERALLAAAARARVARAAMFVCGQAIQLHGGIGVTDEYPVGHFFKRALAFQQRHGGAERQVERFAELRRA